MSQAGFEPGSSREGLLEFDTYSKPLGHHGRLDSVFVYKDLNMTLMKDGYSEILLVSVFFKNKTL